MICMNSITRPWKDKRVFISITNCDEKLKLRNELVSEFEISCLEYFYTVIFLSPTCINHKHLVP